MKTTLRLLCSAAVLCASSGSAFAAAECGNVTIASFNWQSAELLANIDKLILRKGYGCDAQTTTGDSVPSLTAMSEKGKPDIAPEAAVDEMPGVIVKALADKRLIATIDVLPDGYVDGWWIPKYLADAHPEIKTISDALKEPKLFPAPEDPSKGAVYNGPEGWSSTVITAQLFKAYDAKKSGFVLVSTGSAAGLDATLSKAYDKQQGWLGFYWEPTSLLGKYKMVKLQGAPHAAAEWKRCNTVADCPDPKPNDWPKGHAKTLVTSDFAKRAPAPVRDYLGKRALKNADVDKELAWDTEHQAAGDDGAKHFLKTREDLWTQWVTPEAASKIKGSL